MNEVPGNIKKVVFSARMAWAQYAEYCAQDPKYVRRINQLIRDIIRSPYEGVGKPEPLRGNLSGWWSRRIDSKNRIVYRLADEGRALEILAIGGHYD